MCGERFDPGDLTQVLYHESHKPVPVALGTDGEPIRGEAMKEEMTMGEYKFEIYEDASKEWRWRFKAPNGQIMATSGEGYTEKGDCRSALVRLKEEALQARIEGE